MARDRGLGQRRADLAFKGRQFTAEMILWAVRWYLMFPISYRDLELMLQDCGVRYHTGCEVTSVLVPNQSVISPSWSRTGTARVRNH